MYDLELLPDLFLDEQVNIIDVVNIFFCEKQVCYFTSQYSCILYRHQLKKLFDAAQYNNLSKPGDIIWPASVHSTDSQCCASRSLKMIWKIFSLIFPLYFLSKHFTVLCDEDFALTRPQKVILGQVIYLSVLNNMFIMGKL